MRKRIDDDPDLQAAFVHGMMFAFTAQAEGMDVPAIGKHLCKIWAIGDVERVAAEYGDIITTLLLARPQ